MNRRQMVRILNVIFAPFAVFCQCAAISIDELALELNSCDSLVTALESVH